MEVLTSKIRRQTHMRCIICQDVAETYAQKQCFKCGSVYKWSIPWKNETS
jgi:rRNA maturation endonuclease Nob1